MDFEEFIDRNLWLIDTAAGHRTDLCIQIGRPRWKEPGIEALCLVQIRGLMDEPLNIFGADLMNAIECALDFVESELKNLPVNQVVQWPGGELYFDV